MSIYVPPNPDPTPLPVLLNTQEAAALLRCAPATLHLDRVRHRWKVPFLVISRRCIRYDRAAVLQWLADRNAPSQPKQG
jgi:hypothetical protein